MLIFRLLAIVVMLAGSYSNVFSQRDWFLQIKPLEMHRDQLGELIRANPVEVRDEEIVYKLKASNLFIGLTVGNCKEKVGVLGMSKKERS